MQQHMQQDEEGRRGRVLAEAGIGYSVATVLPVLFSLILILILPAVAGSGYRESDWFKYISYLLPQLCFAATAILFFRRSGTKPRTVYRGCKWYWFAAALLLQFGVMFSLSELNEYFVRLLELMGYTRADSALPTLDGWNLLPAILVIAVLPAVFEETLFRGILVGSMREGGWGTVPIVFISGALFSLFHTDPEQTVYQFVCGVCFALIALRSGSVLPTVAAHFVNNAVILILSSCGFVSFAALPDAAYIALVIVSAVCLVGTVLFLILFNRKQHVRGGMKEGKKFFLMAAVGIAVCAVEWVALLIERML